MTTVDMTAAIKRYINDHPGTITGFDQVAGSSPQRLTLELVEATRKVSSRISKVEAQWFVEKAESAPWHLVMPDEDFADADVLEVGGLYDRATMLWNHFAAPQRANVADAKISKVLFLMRPCTFPIIDSRLKRSYRSAARLLHSTVYKVRPELQGVDGLTWEALRLDLVKCMPDLQAARGQLAVGSEFGGLGGSEREQPQAS